VAEISADELMALMASKRAAMGIILDDNPPPPPPPADKPARAVERELASTVNARASSRLEAQLKQTLSGERSVSTLTVPTGPDLRVIDLVHRGHDGYIPLARKDNAGEWQDLGCVPAKVLRGLFGAEWLTTELETDAYFSMHGMFRSGFYRHKTTLKLLEPSLRKARHVRWLTTCHVDLDLYNVGMDPEDGVATVLRAARDGIIPPPSMFSLSRGCWAWWLLRDDEGRGPVRAWPDNVDRWSTLQGTLHHRLAKLGSDPAALHQATVTRIPGSYSSKTRRRVAWMACFDDAGKPFVYTMRELADGLGITDRPRPAAVIEHKPADRAKDAARVELGRRGYHSRWTRYLAVLDQLRRMRGGWRVGTRTKAIHLVAHACRARAWTTEVALAELSRHLEGMEQPAGDKMTTKDLRRILKSTSKPKAGGIRWQTVADHLDISPDESGILSTSTSSIPPARRFDQLPAVPVIPPEERLRRRRSLVAQLLAKYEEGKEHWNAQWRIPTTKDLREMLVAAGHEGASDKTLLKDMEALGKPSPRRHKPRKPADPRLPLQTPE
jgi:hypothetical protein